MNLTNVLPWILFHVFILLMLGLDLGLFHRQSHVVKLKEALTWSAVWIALALIFNVGIYAWKGPEAGLQFLTGYLIEKSLSVDNIFIFVVIFSSFGVPDRYQHKVLFWGILGALVMRATLIAVGTTLMQSFHGIVYVFGAFLIFTGVKMAIDRNKVPDPTQSPILRFFKRWLPVTSEYHEDRFFVRKGTRRFATPLFLALLVVEATDLVFAVDSIPAIFAVTSDPFIVYTSNIFAILGLRSLFFALAGIITRFHLLKVGLSAVLVFVGAKMVMADFYKVPVGAALAVVAGILSLSIVASLVWPKEEREA